MTITATATTATTADVHSGSHLMGHLRSDNEGATWTVQIADHGNTDPLPSDRVEVVSAQP
ncbi:MAG: hypothetical protein ACTH0C_12750 [Actinomycetaceae bacterium]